MAHALVSYGPVLLLKISKRQCAARVHSYEMRIAVEHGRFELTANQSVAASLYHIWYKCKFLLREVKPSGGKS